MVNPPTHPPATSLPPLQPIQLEWSHYQPRFDALKAQPLSAKQVPAWLAQWSDLSKELSEVGSVLSLAADLNTADAAAQSALNAFREGIGPERSRAEQGLRQKLLGVEGYVPAPDVALMYRRMKDAADFYRESNVPLEVQHEAQMQRHAEITGGQSVQLDGRAMTVPEASSHLGSPLRPRREEVWRALSDSRQEVRGALNDLMLALLATRRQLAANAELSDYRAYSWHVLDRVDYTPQDCLDFHAAIRGEVVPLATALMQAKAKQLGLESLRPWDASRSAVLDEQGRSPLRPFTTGSELESLAQRVFDALDPELGAQFTQARSGLLDLESRPNKMSHAYCASFEQRGVPFIVQNVVGTSGDVNTLLHEMGHGFHFFASAAAQPLIWNRWSPIEFVEVPSMAMEYLALAHLQGAYSPSELQRVKREQLESAILFLPWAAQMDAFQHWLYAQAPQALDIDALNAKWLELDNIYHPWVNWESLDEQERASGWHYFHIFRAPFYYLEYAMCSLGALSIWRSSMADAPAALQRYKAALRLGNTASVPQLYEAAGTQFLFDREYVRGLMTFVGQQLAAPTGESA